MNILEIVVIILTAGLAIGGWRRGFVRKLASMLSFVISIVLVSVFLPYMTSFLKTETPVYDYIVKQCREVMTENVTGALTAGSADESSGLADTYMQMDREQIKSLMEQNGYDSSMVDALSDEELEEYKEKYIGQYVQQYLGGAATPAGEALDAELSKIEQTELIESLPIPEVLRELLLNYNNDEGYSSLGVSRFSDYLISFIATVILNVIAFVAAVILVQLLLHLAIGALDILAHIPLIGGLNRLLGLLLGLVQALFFLWLFFLILSMASATQWGLRLMDMVQSSELLCYLYDSNLFLKIVVQTAAMFV